MNKIQDIEEQEKLKSLVPELNKKFSDASAEDIVGYFLQAFKGRIALSLVGFRKESAGNVYDQICSHLHT